jgi:hypothetical protein
MSFSAPDPLLLAGLTSGRPVVSQSEVPAGVRAGNAKAKEAYSEGLAFEQILVQQLTQQLADSSSPAPDASDGSDSSSSSDQSGGLLGGSSSGAGYASLIPQALTSTIMSAGGLGIAQEIATAIDPTINDGGKAAK